LSRAGKSTLINALLEQDISPVGKLPTTGIPITILPKDENKVFITLKENGKIIEGKTSSDFLAEYSAQDKNPRNKKGVKHIRVHVINHLLERGFALCDVPGLDDADPEIKNIAKTAIFNSNAIIYVISLAGYLDGEFRINDKNIEDLNELRGKIDRVFLVFNKADKLNDEELSEVKEYIDQTLEQFDVLNLLAAPPIYISSQEAFERRIKKQPGTDTVSQLEQILWEYLINQNKTGFRKLMSNFANELELIKRLENISKIRLESTDQRESLENEICQVKNAIEQLNVFIFNKRQAIYEEVNLYVIDRFNNVTSHLTMELNGVTSVDMVPNSSQMSDYLENEAYKILSDVYEFIQRESYFLQGEVNSWVKDKLKQVEFSLEGSNNQQDLVLPDINQYTGQVYSFFVSNNITHTGIFESIIIVIGQAIETLYNNVVDYFTDDQKILQRDLTKIIKNSRASYNLIQTQLLQNVSDYLNKLCVNVYEKTRDRTKVYLGELNNEARKLDTPLSSFERESHIQFIQEIEDVEAEIKSQINHLNSHIEGIDFFKH
jgi:GTP-binding protein EngB required for normal cell division